MKKITKLGILSLALASAFTFAVLSNVNANEQTLLTIENGSDVCADIDNFDFGTASVSAIDQVRGPVTNPFYCSLMDSSAGNSIIYHITDMTGGTTSWIIEKENFTEASAALTVTGNIGTVVETALVDTDTYYSGAQHMPEVGEFTGDVSLTLTIPAYTQADSYVGVVTLDL